MNVLLAIDQSAASEKAIGFVAEMFAARDDGGDALTLLHVVESLPDFIVRRSADPDADERYRHVADEWSGANREAGETLLDRQKQALVDAGVTANVDTKLVVREGRPEASKVIAALAIIEEMQAGSYDVVCLGRRGTSSAMGRFPGSVAEKVLREAEGRTVWVVD